MKLESGNCCSVPGRTPCGKVRTGPTDQEGSTKAVARELPGRPLVLLQRNAETVEFKVQDRALNLHRAKVAGSPPEGGGVRSVGEGEGVLVEPLGVALGVGEAEGQVTVRRR